MSCSLAGSRSWSTTATPDESIVIDYGPREFLGEIGLLTGQRVFLTARATVDGRILRLPADQVRVVMAEEPDLSEILLRTFLIRHARLTLRGAGLTLVGSRFDLNTRKLLEVLARNRLAFRWLELEGSPEAEAMMRQFDVPVADLPLVVAPAGLLLRNPDGPALLGALGLVAAPEADRDPKSATSWWSVLGPPASRRPSTGRRRG